MSVGDTNTYTITVNLPATVDYSKKVIVHDTLDSALSYKGDVAVDKGSVTAKTTGLSDSCTMEFTIDISSLAPAAGATATAQTITLTYTAELTSAAAADTDYSNKEFVEYSDYKTPEKEVKTKTYDFNLSKVFIGDTTNTNLQATFELRKGGTAISFITDATGLVKKDSDDTGANTTITVTQGTELNIRGLEAGTYELAELSTETGYNPLDSTISVVIADDGSVSLGNEGDLFALADGTVTVTNNTGSTLPSTGGIGTTIFYIVGAILVVGSSIVLVSRKRMQNK